MLILCGATSFNSLYAMGSKRPTTPVPTPTPTNPTPTPPPTSVKPTLDFGASLGPHEYMNSSSQIGPAVDDMKGDDELAGKPREKINTDTVDQTMVPMSILLIKSATTQVN